MSQEIVHPVMLSPHQVVLTSSVLSIINGSLTHGQVKHAMVHALIKVGSKPTQLGPLYPASVLREGLIYRGPLYEMWQSDEQDQDHTVARRYSLRRTPLQTEQIQGH